jgi:exodeoxyribonuclease V beta subunit
MSETLRYPRPPEVALLGHGHNVVESSAGTGKTFLLEHLFVDLILTRGLSCEEILVVTFTEKATAELVLRLRKLIARLANLRADDAMAIAGSHAPADTCWTMDANAKRLLCEALLAFDRASIFTIHGFCQRVLRDHAFVQGRFFDEELIGEEAVFSEAFHGVLRTQVSHDSGLVAALEAWAASGKAIADLEELLRKCAGKEAAPLRMHFDEACLAQAMAAWQPIEDEQLKRYLKEAKVHSSTVKAILSRLSRLSEIITACHGDPVRFLAAMQSFPSEAHPDDRLAYLVEKLPTTSATMNGLVGTVRELHKATVPLEVLLVERLLPLIRERAASRKRNAGLFDFSDMLSLVAKALADPGPAGRALLEALRRRYRHALIDEFQDTDNIQWSIFRRIFVEGSDGHGHDNHLTVIGDPKQAIYGFRGADVQAYLDATRALQEAGGTCLVLDRNFRSTAGIVEATNLLFDQNAEFFRRASGIAYDHPVRCGREDLRLLDESTTAGAPVVVFGLATEQKSLRTPCARGAVEAAIVGELRSLLDPASPLRLSSREGDRPLRARDVFILTFTNSESRAIGRALAVASIPFAFYKLGHLFTSPEAAEVLTVLRAIAAPEDRSLRAQALLTGFFNLDVIGAAACADLGQTAASVQLLLHFARLADEGDIPALFASMIDDSGIVRREVFANAGERTLTNITHVLEVLQAEWTRSHASLPELTDLLGAFINGTRMPPGQEGDLQRLETDKDAVQILTVHKAKGLEADVVFIYGGTGEKSGEQVRVFHEDGQRVLHVGRLDDEGKRLAEIEKEDERSRLLYVALTRARYRLYLSHYPPEFGKLKGPYGRANQRLDDILGQRNERSQMQFHVLPCPADSIQRLPASPARSPVEIASFATQLAFACEPADLATIKSGRSGFLVTSYTAVKRVHGGFAPMDIDVQGDEEIAPIRSDSAEGLPGGADTGIFLHEILATVSLAELAQTTEFTDWIAKPTVAALLERIRRRNARPLSHLPLAAQLVHRAYTARVRLGNTVIPGLASANVALREMEFLFPIPERKHPLLSQTKTDAGEPPWKVERGAVKGFVDLLFEHEGCVFVCDWKSDDLPRFDRDTLARHCHENYDVQARIYTIATLRMCGITTPADYAQRFGGVVYCFLRGQSQQDDCAGIHFFKPAWEDILAWETEMLGQQFWGIQQ